MSGSQLDGDQINHSLLKPVSEVEVIDLTAVVKSTDPANKTAVLSGKGTPGATVIIRDKDGKTLGYATIGQDGNWETTIKGLQGGSNLVHVVSPDGKGENDAKGIDLNIDMPIAGLVAGVDSTDDAKKSAEISGKGEPGATITLTYSGNRVVTTTVDKDGNWHASTPNLNIGKNPVHVTHTVNGTETAATDLNVTIAAADLVAGIDSTDDANKSAEISGKGEPGATITVTYPDNNTITTTVDKDGNWHASTPNLTVGENTIHVTHTVNGTETAATDLTAIIGEQATPAVNPAIAASALGLGLAGGALRRITKKQS